MCDIKDVMAIKNRSVKYKTYSFHNDTERILMSNDKELMKGRTFWKYIVETDLLSNDEKAGLCEFFGKMYPDLFKFDIRKNAVELIEVEFRNPLTDAKLLIYIKIREILSSWGFCLYRINKNGKYLVNLDFTRSAVSQLKVL